ncbi:hypothetical protein DACRYDRAFT_103956 [Dacryopinax primogenitus]|uniref:Aminoglycoside phosphotransferase domain-containing protein n=1 Tax=Dacryopinax primogenitus (strain DJM 731) TaxID=1858805 RepID=M5GGG9_DACPD|nr:uncharacterized protein DACRYDRAFT_103956 [Dacryopinax primogenitus]EJU05468.1 hypothetical protein DACRYDRAFT_103956 [Dacryopinax primogenitus]
MTKRDLLEAFAFLGKPGLMPLENRGPGRKLIELYDFLDLHAGDQHTFHFSHGDLAGRNILVDNEGNVAALLDFGNAGFRPGELAVTLPDFIDNDADKTLYISALQRANGSLYRYYIDGTEQRKMYEYSPRS